MFLGDYSPKLLKSEGIIDLNWKTRIFFVDFLIKC